MATVSVGTTSERFGFIALHGAEFGVRYLCQWFDVSRSGYYDWLKRPASQRTQDDQRLLQRIQSIYEASREVYGSPRVHQALRRQGVRVGKKRVERLMRESELRGRVVRVTLRKPGLKQFIASGENLRLSMPETTAADQVWVGDITYLKVAGYWAHLAVVMDVHSRRVLGWTLNKGRTVQITLTALRQAIRRRIPATGCLFHSDRGVEYTAYRYQHELQRHGMTRSVNRPSKCTDNAHMESFFHSLKAELIRGRTFSSLQELRYALNSYINQFYNHKRLHSGLNYCTPVEYERMATRI